jgi:hypothetical protein
MSQNAQITHKKVNKRNKRHKGVKIVLSIFNLFFETTGPIGTKLGRNVHWKVLFVLIKNTQKKEEAQRCQKEFCMWNIYFSTDIDVFVSLCDMLM